MRGNFSSKVLRASLLKSIWKVPDLFLIERSGKVGSFNQPTCNCLNLVVDGRLRTTFAGVDALIRGTCIISLGASEKREGSGRAKNAL